MGINKTILILAIVAAFVAGTLMANPIVEAASPVVQLLTNPDFGLAEIKKEIRFIEGNITSSIFGLEEIKNEIRDIEAQLDRIESKLTLSCGDGIVSGAEECDDGNTTGGDGCSSTCQLEMTELICDDVLDNEGDGLVDCDDPDCNGLSCGPFNLVCSGFTCVCPGGTTELICDDALDNDCDGLVDCDDSDCVGNAACV